MAETKRWSGNTTTGYSLYDDEMDRMVKFIHAHKSVYIYGKGKIGKALGHYLKQAELAVEGYIVTDEWDAFKRIYKEGETGVLAGVSDGVLKEIMKQTLCEIQGQDVFILSARHRETIGNCFTRDRVEQEFWLNIYVTSACNLKCRSCSAFAPVCAPDYYEPEQFQRDIRQVSRLGLTGIGQIKFTGAEALMHPRIIRLFEIAREYFHTIDFECYTNGLLLAGIGEEKLARIKELGITLVITEYPLENLDLTGVYGKLDRAGVKYNVIYSEGQKYFSKRPLNFNKETPKHLFYYCPRYRMCDSLFLFRGRLYKCIYALSAYQVNQAFHKSLEVLEGDYVDIYNTTPDHVYHYCISRIPFCGYCSPIEELVPWGLSEGRIEEWT